MTKTTAKAAAWLLIRCDDLKTSQWCSLIKHCFFVVHWVSGYDSWQYR